jgi:hypothetical protein
VERLTQLGKPAVVQLACSNSQVLTTTHLWLEYHTQQQQRQQLRLHRAFFSRALVVDMGRYCCTTKQAMLELLKFLKVEPLCH